MAAKEADAVARDLRMATADHIAWLSKVIMDVGVDSRCARL